MLKPSRAQPSGFVLTGNDAAMVKGMLLRGDRQHDVAAWFGVNAGRIAEIAKGRKFNQVTPQTECLPLPGPYPSGRANAVVMAALEQAKSALANAEQLLAKSQ